MTKQQAQQAGQAIGFILCGSMALVLSWTILRAFANTAQYWL